MYGTFNAIAMFLYEIVQTILFLIIGVVVFFILSFLLINTGQSVQNMNKKFHSIIYITMCLTLILTLFLFGLQWYVLLITFVSGWWVYKLFC